MYVTTTAIIRSRARPARKMGDMRWQVSWLAALAPRSSLPGDRQIASGQLGEG
jgi:hypothetical protein